MGLSKSNSKMEGHRDTGLSQRRKSKEEQTDPKVIRRKEMTRIREEINKRLKTVEEKKER